MSEHDIFHAKLTCTHLLASTNAQDSLKENEAGQEEVEGNRGVAVAPQESHQEAETNEDHNLDVDEPVGRCKTCRYSS